MIAFATRRWRNVLILAVVATVLVVVHQAYAISLQTTNVVSGWLLFGLVVLLTLYNTRKKLPFLPLGSSASWLQFHIYAGLLTAVLFLLHIGIRIPNGTVEGALALLFLAVVGTGVVGIALSRMFARRLTTRGDEVIFERIPAMRKRLREKAEELVERCASETSSTVIADFYVQRLANFFAGPRNIVSHLVGSQRPRQDLVANLGALDRYLSTQERECAGEIGTLIRAKDDLDHHTSLQGVLKYWLFLHIPLTYSLLIVAVLHAVLASGYSVR